MLISDDSLSEIHKTQIGYQGALTEKALLDGANEGLQQRAFFSFVLSLSYKH
jgi:hypothetical protein